MNHPKLNRANVFLIFFRNKSCAICRKKSTLQAAVKLYPQFDEEPSEEELKLLSRVRELEEKMSLLQSEVDYLHYENRRLKCSVEITENKHVDYKEFIEDFANDLMKTANKIHHPTQHE